MTDLPPNADGLGSLAQSARKTSLTNARRILFVLATLQIVLGVGLVAGAEAVAKIRVAAEVKRMGGGVDPDDVREAEADEATALRLTGAFLAGLGATFLALGLLVYRFPVAATVSALVLYVGVQLLNAAGDPAAIKTGLLIKIIVVVALVRAVQAAVAYERESRELAADAAADAA